MSKREILEHPDLRRVWDLMEAESPPVEWDALTALRSTAQPRARTRPDTGLWLAATVFALVLVVGGVALITRETDDVVPGGPLANLNWDLMIHFPPPADPEAFVDQIEAIDGVDSVDYYPNAAVFEEPAPAQADESPVETTIVGPVTGSTGLASGSTAGFTTMASALVLLEDPDLAESVAHVIDQQFDLYVLTFSDEIADARSAHYFDSVARHASVIAEDPLMLQPPPGPEPEFDTDALGTEVVLTPASTGDEVPEMFWELSANSMVEEDGDRPVLHIGYVEEIDTRVLVFESASGGRCEAILTQGGSGSFGCHDFTRYGYGVSGSGGQEGMLGEVEVEVPEGTSVVTISEDGVPPRWQRPVAGWAVLPVEVHDFPDFEVVAYDSSGQVIGRWDQGG
jgi:hypothetical protein